MTTAVRTTTWLVADLGGTNARLGLLQEDSSLAATTTMRCSELSDVASAVRGYLDTIPAERRPSRGCLAVAAPVDGDRVRFTNNALEFSRTALQQELGLEQLLVVNDVAAAARGVGELRPGQALSLTGQALDHTRTIAVVAPGTGLGVAALIPTACGPVVLPGEGGQVPLPVTPRSARVVRELTGSGARLCAEDLVSGRGLPRLDLALGRLRGGAARGPRTATVIGASGEVAPGEVLDVFVELLASVCQSHVLTLGARGGLVLGGGFLRDLQQVLHACGFVERFRSHPKLARYLADVPVVVDIRAHPSLVGAAAFAQDAA